MRTTAFIALILSASLVAEGKAKRAPAFTVVEASIADMAVGLVIGADSDNQTSACRMRP